MPSDIWSIQEQLYLSSSVLKSGDQNWISVSRFLGAVKNRDPLRPADWFSQKSCAQQYARLLGNIAVPKRKKKDGGETTGEFIVRRLTHDRIAELSRTLPTQREEYQQLKNEICLLTNATISHEKLQKIWSSIERENEELKQSSKIQFNIPIEDGLNKDVQVIRTSLMHKNQNKNTNSLVIAEEVPPITTIDVDRKNSSDQSFLLTNLLKSTNPTSQSETHTQPTNSPTIASLLCSSPKVPEPMSVQIAPSYLDPSVGNTLVDDIEVQSSVMAPTLSKLLEQSSTYVEKNSIEENHTAFNHSKNTLNSTKVQNITKTRSAKLSKEKSVQDERGPKVTFNEKSTNAKTNESTFYIPCNETVQERMPIDKDEINEIIGDIEEFIQEDITNSPPSLSSTFDELESKDDSLALSTPTERSKPRNVDESASLSNSPTCEMTIEEIDSSSSNIAKIIGTAVETIEPKMRNFYSPDQKEHESSMTDYAIDRVIKIETNIAQEVAHEETKYSENSSGNQLIISKFSHHENKMKKGDQYTSTKKVIASRKMKNEVIERGIHASCHLLENRPLDSGMDSTSIDDEDFHEESNTKLEEAFYSEKKLEGISINRRLSSLSAQVKYFVHPNLIFFT